MEILEKLKAFIHPHPLLHPEAGDVFTPNGEVTIRFFFEGGFSVEGYGPELEINFNDKELLILSTGDSVYRFKRSALVGFELILRKKSEPREVKIMRGLH